MLTNNAIRKAVGLGAKYYIPEYYPDGTLCSLQFIKNNKPETLTYNIGEEPREYKNCFAQVGYWLRIQEDFVEINRPYAKSCIPMNSGITEIPSYFFDKQ